jgi:linoleoyl-CoA desaturase
MYLLGASPINWKFQHNTLHHGYTNIDGMDEDIAPLGILRFSPHKPLLKIHRFQQFYAWFFYGLMTISWVTGKDFKRLRNYYKMNAPLSSSKSYSRLVFDLALSKGVYFALLVALPIILLPISWYWVLALFLFMHFITGFILGIVFQTAHVVPSSEYPLPNSDGALDNNWMIHQLHTTADYSPKSRIFSWFIGGLNYQVEHHLFPNICHVHYKKIAAIVKEFAHEKNLPYHVQHSFFGALINHFKMLRYLGQASRT